MRVLENEMAKGLQSVCDLLESCKACVFGDDKTDPVRAKLERALNTARGALAAYTAARKPTGTKAEKRLAAALRLNLGDVVTFENMNGTETPCMTVVGLFPNYDFTSVTIYSVVSEQEGDPFEYEDNDLFSVNGVKI